MVTLRAPPIGSLVAALSPIVEWLIGARVIQEAGGGVLPLSFGIIRQPSWISGCPRPSARGGLRFRRHHQRVRLAAVAPGGGELPDGFRDRPAGAGPRARVVVVSGSLFSAAAFASIALWHDETWQLYGATTV